MRFKDKLVSRIKELRELNDMKQQDLADLLGVSRQTIYYLEKGSYNPSLTISFKIAEVFDDKSLKEIFYQEPIIKDILKSKTLEELDTISYDAGIATNQLIQLTNIDDDKLRQNFTKQQLENITESLGLEFDELFEE